MPAERAAFFLTTRHRTTFLHKGGEVRTTMNGAIGMFERMETGNLVEATSSPALTGLALGETASVAGIKERWDRVRRRLRAELGEDVFSSWFARVEIGAIVEGVAHLTVPTRFLKSWLEAHYAERLRAHCMAELDAPNGVTLAVRQVARESAEPGQDLSAQRARPAQARIATATAEAPPASAAVQPSERDPMDACGTLLDRRMTFQSFVVGKSNALAFAAAERISAAPAGATPYNPLYPMPGSASARRI
jgi:chromosomal replication initiator protein